MRCVSLAAIALLLACGGSATALVPGRQGFHLSLIPHPGCTPVVTVSFRGSDPVNLVEQNQFLDKTRKSDLHFSITVPQVLYVGSLPVLYAPGDSLSVGVFLNKPGDRRLWYRPLCRIAGAAGPRQRLLYDLDSLYNVTEADASRWSFEAARNNLEAKDRQAQAMIRKVFPSGAGDFFRMAMTYNRILCYKAKAGYLRVAKLAGDPVVAHWELEGQDLDDPYLPRVEGFADLSEYSLGILGALAILHPDWNTVNDPESIHKTEYVLYNVKSDMIRRLLLGFLLDPGVRIYGLSSGKKQLFEDIRVTVRDKNVLRYYDSLYRAYEVTDFAKFAYDFSAEDNQGKVVHLSDFKGKMVVIDTWATWCHTCVANLPYFDSVAALYKDNPRIVFVTLDYSEMVTEDSLKKFEKDHGMESVTNLIVPAGERSGFDKGYAVTGIPRYIAVDCNGRLLSAWLPLPSDPAFALFVNLWSRGIGIEGINTDSTAE